MNVFTEVLMDISNKSIQDDGILVEYYIQVDHCI